MSDQERRNEEDLYKRMVEAESDLAIALQLTASARKNERARRKAMQQARAAWLKVVETPWKKV